MQIELDLNAVLNYILSVLDYMRTVSVQIGDVTVDLLSLELGFILVAMIIYFVNTFTGGDDVS